MTSFELANQKLKYMFGGVEAEVNSSVEYLNAQHKKTTTNLQTSSNLYRKIQGACITLKQCSIQLLDMYKTQMKGRHTVETGSIEAVINQTVKAWSHMGDEISELKKRIDTQLESFLPSIKKLYTDHKEAAQELEHYKQKVFLLQRRFGEINLKQDDTNKQKDVRSEDASRYHRNQQKLKNSQTKYDNIVAKISEKCRNFKNQGENTLINNYSDCLISLCTYQEALRFSISKWLRVNQKRCHCQNQELLKFQINNFVKGSTKSILQPACVKIFFKKANQFETLDSVFSKTLEIKVNGKKPNINVLQSFDRALQSNSFRQPKQPNLPQIPKPVRKQSEQILSKAFSNKQQDKDCSINDKTPYDKLQAGKKILVQKSNKKPNFDDFLDLMNM